MLQVKNISLYNFKNYEELQLPVNSRIIAICGLNGCGKTNLLDAVYYACFTKSFFQRTDSILAHKSNEGFRLEVDFEKDENPFRVTSVLRENNRKEFSLNSEEYKKLSKHIGLLPCVMIAPDDIEIITGASEQRRKLIDVILSQFNEKYLDNLIEYNKLLQQRNSFLKNAAQQSNYNTDVLEILNEQLVQRGNSIFLERKMLMEKFIPQTIERYQYIAEQQEPVQIVYESDLHQYNFRQLLQDNLQRDLYLQRTTTGIHKDDLNILLNRQPFKSIASQGQRKSLLFALKLVEFNLLEQLKNITPILLLDDVFEKLDAVRMHKLLQQVCVEKKGQVFITDTHKSRLAEHLRQLQVTYQMIDLSKEEI
ncbi:MAG: DNA replication and repair protein RecF [Sphingobacteriia bacterium]|nr:DNA replication and repair protein RecF [Sphingobacteriia bacterium]